MAEIDTKKIDRNNIESASANSVVAKPTNSMAGGVNPGLLYILTSINEITPPWWSKSRDIALRQLWKESDHLSGALYNFTTKLQTVPLHITAKDKSIKTHVKLAKEYQRIIMEDSNMGKGWDNFFYKWLADLVTQDNGAFFEIIGDGDPSSAIRGRVYTIRHLDSSKCIRRDNWKYPVTYTNKNGKQYKLHYTRVSATSQQPSPDDRMNDVGFCAVSRAILSARNLIDIATYKMEKLGSAPHKQILLTGGGLSPDDVLEAYNMTEIENLNRGRTRYSNSIVVGDRVLTDPKIEQIELTGVPDNFDEKESTILGMAVIALAFGMDARELFPMLESGATKADAIISHIKQRGKAPGHILSIMTNILNTWVLPPVLEAKFDYQDDTQDRQVAEIQSIRSRSRQVRLENGITNQRIERQKMLDEGEITVAQFEELELSDGRLADGVNVEILFLSKDKDFQELLGGTNEDNWKEKLIQIQEIIITSRDAELIRKARQAQAAIKSKYDILDKTEIKPDNIKNPNKPDRTYEEERFRDKLPRQPQRVAANETEEYINRNN